MSDMPPPTILVIDDEELICWSLDQLLSKEGYRVHVARSGEAGLALFETHHPDLVLLDLRLPDVDGLQLLPRLKTNRASLPVIIMTAYGSTDLERQARDLGACDFLHKPFEPADLRLCLRQALLFPNAG